MTSRRFICPLPLYAKLLCSGMDRCEAHHR